jgi:carbonic anhydrase
MHQWLRFHTAKSQEKITPDMAVNFLKKGNERFQKELRAVRSFKEEVKRSKNSQYPFATILTCMDSRVVPEYIFDQGLGDIFTLRTAGALLHEDILRGMELSTKVLGSKLIVVMSHTNCGLITFACGDTCLGSINPLLEKVNPAIDTVKKKGKKKSEIIDAVATAHIDLTIAEIYKKSPAIQELEEKKLLKIIGALYHVETGVVYFKDDEVARK